MKVADAIWLATALLHMEHPNATDFSIQEIVEKVMQENLVDGFKPGLQVHASKHCVANKSPNPGRYRMLFETARGRRRLFRMGDTFHPNRNGGRIKPDLSDFPRRYQGVLAWYERSYNKSNANAAAEADCVVRPANTDFSEIKNTLDRMSPEELLELRTLIISRYTESKSSKRRA